MTPERPSTKIPAFIITCSLMLSLVLAMSFPLVTDEVYYISWARSLEWPSWGFFDHPPVVSWMGIASRYSNQLIAARAFVWLCSATSAFFTWRLARFIMPSRSLIAPALILSSIGGIASGFLLTPDSGLILAWSLAVHEGYIALTRNPKRWLSAGLATGFGILCKYTMVLIGPVFLFSLWRDARRQLRTPWPYLGGVICLIVILPHLRWQHENNWVTFKFQFRHGFSVEHDNYSHSHLPRAEIANPGSKVLILKDRLLASMQKVPGFDEAIKKPKSEKSALEKAWQYSGDYIGGVAGLWGFYAIAWLIWMSRRLRKKITIEPASRPPGFSLIQNASLFPLIFFFILSPFTKIEANWPAMHMTALAVWMIYVVNPPTRQLAYAFFCHLLLFCLIIVVMLKPEFFSGARNNRLLLESRGYSTLSQWVESTNEQQVIAVDSYQLRSAIEFYAPNVKVVQWPGFTRDSEYTRGRVEDSALEEKIRRQAIIRVVASDSKPKSVPGFEAMNYQGIRVCLDGSIGVFSEKNPTLPCEKGIREWWITDYSVQNP